MVQLVPASFFSDVWLSVLECCLSHVCGFFADSSERYSNLGEARIKEMGASDRIPKVSSKHSCTDPFHLVDMRWTKTAHLENLQVCSSCVSDSRLCSLQWCWGWGGVWSWWKTYTGTNIVGSHVLYVSEYSTVYYKCTDTARAVNHSTSYMHCMFTLFVN